MIVMTKEQAREKAIGEMYSLSQRYDLGTPSRQELEEIFDAGWNAATEHFALELAQMSGYLDK